MGSVTSSPLGERYRPISTLDDEGNVVIDTLLFYVYLLKPRSSGYVSINTTDVHAFPIIDEKMFSVEEDLIENVDALKRALDFINSTEFQSLGIEDIILDPRDLCSKGDPKNFYKCIVLTYTAPGHHVSGTARMGQATDPMTVVDPELKVIGVNRLRVIDASVMPSVPRGNTNIPTIMIAEKGADIIKKHYGVSRESLLLERFDDVKLLKQLGSHPSFEKLKNWVFQELVWNVKSTHGKKGKEEKKKKDSVVEELPPVQEKSWNEASKDLKDESGCVLQ